MSGNLKKKKELRVLKQIIVNNIKKILKTVFKKSDITGIIY